MGQVHFTDEQPEGKRVRWLAQAHIARKRQSQIWTWAVCFLLATGETGREVISVVPASKVEAGKKRRGWEMLNESPPASPISAQFSLSVVNCFLPAAVGGNPKSPRSDASLYKPTSFRRLAISFCNWFLCSLHSHGYHLKKADTFRASDSWWETDHQSDWQLIGRLVRLGGMFEAWLKWAAQEGIF